ncbi:lipopolysaccharide biosynthesis protein [Tropicimonas aquimaris]|uniref:Lipopolysaccharide biosynthesis protein n=1 Tax=Tropicimonas aquimaris TaxID=914152 RepID=A0ABW3IYS6_9RHOB
MISGRKSLIYLAANLIAASVPFLLLPILTRLLDQAEYGQVAIFQAFVNVSLAVVGVNTVGAIKRNFFTFRNEGEVGEARYARFIGATMVILVGSLILSFSLVLFLRSWLTMGTGLGFVAMVLGLGVASASFLVSVRLADYQMRGQARNYGIMQIGMALTNLTVSLTIVWFFIRSAEGRILGITIASGFVGTLALISLLRNRLIAWTIDREVIKEALQFGLPLVPHALGVFFLASADRFFIKSYSGLEAVGVYFAAVQITFLLRLVNDAINKSFQPWAFDQLSMDGEKDRRVIGVLYIVGLITFSLAGVLALAGPFLATSVLGEDYSHAGRLVPLLALGTAFHGVYLYLINFLLYEKKTSALASTTIVLGLFNLGLLYLLVPRFGIQGAAMAFAIASFFRALIVLLLCERVRPRDWFKPCF